MVSISGVGSWRVSLLLLACCWCVPTASTQADVDFQCPCLVRSACPQYYGSSPLDVARFGVVPPCPVYGHVRCCLKSAFFHLPAVASDGSSQDAVVVSGFPVSPRARKRFMLRRRRPGEGRFRLNKPASDLHNRVASSDIEDTVVITSSIQQNDIFVQEHSDSTIDETDDHSSSVFAKSLFDSLDSSDGTVFTDSNEDQSLESVPVETVVVTQVSVEPSNESAPTGQDGSESSFAETSEFSPSSDFSFADELIEEISSSDRQHTISESPKSFFIEQITFNSEPDVAEVVDRGQFIVHANAAEGNSFEGNLKNFSLEFDEDSADNDAFEIQFPGDNVSGTSSEVVSAELTGDKDPLGLDLYRIGRHPSVIEFRRISAVRPRNVLESLEPRPPCGCYTCGTCPARYETVSAASGIPCPIGFESCCFPDDPWPGFVLSETAVRAPCSRRERCKRPYGLTALDVQVFSALEPCYLGQVRCMDQLLLEAGAFTADQLVLPAANCRLQGSVIGPDAESDLFVESVLSQVGQQKPTTVEEFAEPQDNEDNTQTDEGAEPHSSSDISSPETELVFGELFVEGDDGFQSANVGIPPFLAGTPGEDVTNTHQVPVELPFDIQTTGESDPETLLGGLPAVSEDVVALSVGEHSNEEAVGTPFDPADGLMEIPAPDMTQSEEFPSPSFDVHLSAPAPTYVYPEPNDGLLFPADPPLLPIPSLYSPPVPANDHLPLSHREFDSRVSEDQTPASSELDLVASPSTHDAFTSRYSSSPMYVVPSPDLFNKVQTSVQSNGHSSFPHTEQTGNSHVYNGYLPPEAASEWGGSGSSFVKVLQPSVSLNVRGHTPVFLPDHAVNTSDLADTRPLSEVHLLVPSGAGVEQNLGTVLGSSTGVDSSVVPGDEADSAVTDLGKNQEYSYSNTTTVLISHDGANTADVSEALFAVVKAASLASQVSSNKDVDTPDHKPDHTPDHKLLTTHDIAIHAPPPIIVESNIGFSSFLVRCVSVSECGRWFGSHPSDLQVLGYLERCPEGFVRCLDGYKNELLQSTLDTTASGGFLQQQHMQPITTADTNITEPVNLSASDVYGHGNDHNSGTEFSEIPPPAETTTRVNHIDSSSYGPPVETSIRVIHVDSSSYGSSVETSTHTKHVDSSSHGPPAETSTHVKHVDSSSHGPPAETSTHVKHVDSSSYGPPAETSTHVKHVDSSSHGPPAETSTHVKHVDSSSHGPPAETSTHVKHVDSSSYGPPAETSTHANHDGYSSYVKPPSYPSHEGRYPVKSHSSQPIPSHILQHRPRIPVFQGVSPNKLSFQAQKTVQVGPLGASHFGKTVSVSTPVKTISGSVSLRNPFLLDVHKKTPVAHHPHKSQHVISKLTTFIKPLAVGIAHKGRLAAHHLNKIPNTFVEKVKGLSQIHHTFSRPIYKGHRSPVLSHTPRYPPRPGRYPPAVGKHRQPTFSAQQPRYRPNLPKTTRRPSTAYGAPKRRPASSYNAPTASHRQPPRRPVQPRRPSPVYRPAVRGPAPGRSPRLLPSGYGPPQHRPTPVHGRPPGYQPSAMNRPPGTKTSHGRPVDYTRRRPAARVPGLRQPIGSFRSPGPAVSHHRSHHRYPPASEAAQVQTVRQHYRPPY